MRGKKLKGSYTIEAAIYIPIILFIICQTMQLALGFWQDCRQREINPMLKELNCVKEFYNYQILDEIRKEITEDES